MKKNFNIDALKRFNTWKSEWNVEKWDLFDYASFHGNIELTISFIELFYPDVIEYEDCIILQKNFNEKNFKDWSEKLSNKSDVESLLNHIHIYDLFENDNEKTDLKNLEYVAKMILKFWQFSIEERFPDKKFDFKFNSAPEDYGPTITFFQKRL